MKGIISIEADNKCEHNSGNKDSKPKCSKPAPGSAAGGCAFDGAQITLLPIADAVHLVHSPSTCIGCSWNNRGTRSSTSALYRYGFTTDLSELDLIFGSEEKLYNAAIEAAERFKPSAVFIYSTCVTAMSGENIEAVSNRVHEHLKIPVIPVDSPGFIGSKNYGNKAAGETLFKYVIGSGEPEQTTDTDICIIADYNIAGEIWRIIDLLKEAGFNVISKITGDSTYKEITYAHKAKANIVVCGRALVGLAEKLKSKYQIPYYEGSFYGINETSKSLRELYKMLNNHKVAEHVENVIAAKEEEINKQLDRYRHYLSGKRVFLYSGGVKSWSMVMQLEELGLEVIGSGIRKSSKTDIDKLRVHFEGKQKTLLEKGDGEMILSLLKKENADLFIAGSRNMYTSIKGRYPYVDVNQERIKSYAGYDGMLQLAEDIYNTIKSPIWDIAKSKAPWED